MDEPLQSPGERKQTILVVDDEKRIADTLVLILQSKGYGAEAVYDAAAGISAYQRHPADLVISDVVMPGMNGVEMAIAIRREFPESRILLFSGQAAAADLLADARRRGFDFEMLAKPLHPEQLLDKVALTIGASQRKTA